MSRLNLRGKFYPSVSIIDIKDSPPTDILDILKWKVKYILHIYISYCNHADIFQNRSIKSTLWILWENFESEWNRITVHHNFFRNFAIVFTKRNSNQWDICKYHNTVAVNIYAYCPHRFKTPPAPLNLLISTALRCEHNL